MIIGFANRQVAQALLAVEGYAYIVAGVQPQSAPGVVNLDYATLAQKLKTYIDGPSWVPHASPFMGKTVLVVVIAPPQPGDPIHVLERTFEKNKATYPEGTIFVRGAAQSEPAKASEVRMLSARLLAGNTIAADVARLAEESEARRAAAVAEHAKRVSFGIGVPLHGQSGFLVQNHGDAAITDIFLQSANGAPLTVYYPSSTKRQADYKEGSVGAGEATKWMVRPADQHGGPAAEWSEADNLVMSFTDANDVHWRRVGTQPPEPV
ncbi:hypothetical protein SKC41_15490 [Mycobacterium sp. 050128]|uniref:hypothetical protein n=1 Tax=Mycobacterium sp. 050128 TaxID=3096112 RepID=UPI002EDA1A84